MNAVCAVRDNVLKCCECGQKHCVQKRVGIFFGISIHTFSRTPVYV